MSTSRERFLQQLDRCVRYQNEQIMLPDPPRSTEMIPDSMQFIAAEEMGNGEPQPEGDRLSVWGLRPPGDTGTGDWA